VRDEETGWIELHAAEFFLLWRGLDLGDVPEWLGIPAFGRTPRARAEWSAIVSEALTMRDLGTVERPAGDLAGLLRTIADAEAMLELQVDTREASLRALGGITAGRAAAVARVNTQVRIGPASSDALVRTMLEVPPPMNPGSGISANLPIADFEKACSAAAQDGVSGFVETLTELGVRREECLVLSKAFGTRFGGGRLGAKARDGRGRWHRAPVTVSWVDAEDGRYALRTDGEWMTVTPADEARLVAMAEEMLDTVV
jgi:hypothetical protein